MAGSGFTATRTGSFATLRVAMVVEISFRPAAPISRRFKRPAPRLILLRICSKAEKARVPNERKHCAPHTVVSGARKRKRSDRLVKFATANALHVRFGDRRVPRNHALEFPPCGVLTPALKFARPRR